MTTLLDYLKRTNRPYGLTDLITNLHNSVSKAVATKALTQLEASGAITSKTYGKSIIYVITQKPVNLEKENDVPGEIKKENSDESNQKLLEQLEAQVLELSSKLKTSKLGMSE